MELADYSVLKREVFRNVYEPAEDTFLLIDALEKDIKLIKDVRPDIVLEVGSGSGVVITTLGKVLKDPFYVCTDLNPLAAEATKSTSKSNNVSVDVIVSNLVDVIKDRLMNSVDLLIFNPPYNVTPSEEVGSDNIFKATSGGFKGREVMDRLFPLLPQILSQKGLFYLTCVIQNDIDEISQLMKSYNLEMTKVLQRKCGIEHIFILRFNFKN